MIVSALFANGPAPAPARILQGSATGALRSPGPCGGIGADEWIRV